MLLSLRPVLPLLQSTRLKGDATGSKEAVSTQSGGWRWWERDSPLPPGAGNFMCSCFASHCVITGGCPQSEEQARVNREPSDDTSLDDFGATSTQKTVKCISWSWVNKDLVASSTLPQESMPLSALKRGFSAQVHSFLSSEMSWSVLILVQSPTFLG